MTALLSQVETARADAVTEFKTIQSFINSYVGYYGDGFEDCLKQVKSVYLHLDLSKVTMDDPLLSTLVGDTTLKGTDDSSKSEPSPKGDNVVLAQPAADALVIPLTSSTDPPDAEEFLA